MTGKIHIKIISAVISMTMLVQGVQYNAYASANMSEDEYVSVQNDVTNITALLGKMLQYRYDAIIQDIKEECLKNDYDFDLTMNGICEHGNPCADLEYMELISAFMTCRNNQKARVEIQDIPFITYKTKKVPVEDCVPYKVCDYEEVSDGIYKKTGYHYRSGDWTEEEYFLDKDGLYRKTGKTIAHKKKIRTGAYLDVEFSCADVNRVFDCFGLKFSDHEEEYQSRLRKLSGVTSPEILKQNIFLTLPGIEELGIEDTYINYDGISGERLLLIRTAAALIGKVPYQWGGKSQKAGYDSSWWSYDASIGKQKGLDCSGFVQWAYRTAGFRKTIWDRMDSTSEIDRAGFMEVSEEELRPGDVGLLNHTSNNHTGIYVGDGKWIHCSSAKGTVVVAPYAFRIFYRPIIGGEVTVSEDAAGQYEYPDIDFALMKDNMETAQNMKYAGQIIPEETAEAEEKTQEKEVNPQTLDIGEYVNNMVAFEQNVVYDTNKGKNVSVFSDADITLMARLVEHEAGNEGINGWIAVAEVVKNRLVSPLFPNTMSEVIYQKKQFTNAAALSGITPRAEVISTCRMVLSGQTSIFNNSDVFFFRNPMITSSIPASSPVDWGRNRYFTYVGNHAFYLKS